MQFIDKIIECTFRIAAPAYQNDSQIPIKEMSLSLNEKTFKFVFASF